MKGTRYCKLVGNKEITYFSAQVLYTKEFPETIIGAFRKGCRSGNQYDYRKGSQSENCIKDRVPIVYFIVQYWNQAVKHRAYTLHFAWSLVVLAVGLRNL